ncbi:MAG: RNA polymerase factor sigma-54, partial [Mucinivorans sp.]
YRLKVNNNRAQEEHYTPTLSQSRSLSDFLLEQLSYYSLTSKQQEIAYFLIGSLDSDGYLRRPIESVCDDLAFTQGMECSEEEVIDVLGVIHQVEPSGIGARTLQECLLIQLDDLRDKSEQTALARTIVKECFEEFSKKHYDKIKTRLKVSDEELRGAIEDIISLNPRPSNGYSDDGAAASPTITPDFILDYDALEDVFDLRLSSRGIPELKINNSYLRMAERSLGSQESSDKEALQFIKGKIDSARWFIAAIKQRQQTLTKTMTAILEFQREYFKEGQEAALRPMILKDIAIKAGFDISTISRVVNSKYIQTHFGIFLLKYFFSEGLSTTSGVDVSTREIKRILRQAVEGESPTEPMTDEQLMELLQGRGFNIARRTVAKYREGLDIPVARLRKKA